VTPIRGRQLKPAGRPHPLTLMAPASGSPADVLSAALMLPGALPYTTTYEISTSNVEPHAGGLASIPWLYNVSQAFRIGVAGPKEPPHQNLPVNAVTYGAGAWDTLGITSYVGGVVGGSRWAAAEAAWAPIAQVYCQAVGINLGSTKPYWDIDPAVPRLAEWYSLPAFVGTASTNTFRLLAEPVAVETIVYNVASEAEWPTPVLKQAKRLASLRRDWDTHGAPPVAPSNVTAALRFLSSVLTSTVPPPAMVPTHNGGVQIEWHRGGLDVEVLFSGNDEDGLYVRDIVTGDEWEGPAVEGFQRLRLAQRLSRTAPLTTA
jgi:hypothetical protein